jgi:hypothetical protein
LNNFLNSAVDIGTWFEMKSEYFSSNGSNWKSSSYLQLDVVHVSPVDFFFGVLVENNNFEVQYPLDFVQTQSLCAFL